MLGVDSLPSAIEEAQRNALANRLSNCQFYMGQAEDMVGIMVQVNTGSRWRIWRRWSRWRRWSTWRTGSTWMT